MGEAPADRRSTIAALQTYSHPPHDEEWGSAFPPSTEVAAAAAAFIAYFCMAAASFRPARSFSLLTFALVFSM